MSRERKPLYDRSEAELLAELRAMYTGGSFMSSPNDIAQELDRRAAKRQGTVAIWTSVVGVVIAMVAVILSAAALIQGAAR